MFNEFMASSPDQKRLLFIHKWYEIDKFKDEQPRISAKKLNQINLVKFKTALLNYAERKLIRHRSRVHNKLLEEIKMRLFKNNYAEKLSYLDF